MMSEKTSHKSTFEFSHNDGLVVLAIRGLQLTIIHFLWDGNDASFGNSNWWTKLVASLEFNIPTPTTIENEDNIFSTY